MRLCVCVWTVAFSDPLIWEEKIKMHRFTFTELQRIKSTEDTIM